MYVLRRVGQEKEQHSIILQKAFDMNMVGIASHKNLILYRYADLLLMLADVYNELDRKDDAINTADIVLARARKSN